MKKYLVPLVRHIKVMSLLGVMFIGTSLLSGCGAMMHRLGYMPIHHSASKACIRATELITNLKEDKHHRHYQLLDGRTCSEVNDYEQGQLQKS